MLAADAEPQPYDERVLPRQVPHYFGGVVPPGSLHALHHRGGRPAVRVGPGPGEGPGGGDAPGGCRQRRGAGRPAPAAAVCAWRADRPEGGCPPPYIGITILPGLRCPSGQPKGT